MKIQQIIYSIGVALLLTACSNFDEINTNRDASTKVKSPLLAAEVIMAITKPGISEDFVKHLRLTKYMAFGSALNPEVYNQFDRESFDGYTTITNAAIMAELAPEKDKKAYQALYLFIHSYILFGYTHNVGDIPYTDILKGKEGLLKPTYTPQEEVVKGILSTLDQAYELFSEATDFEGDPLLNGDVRKWARLVSTFRMRVLIELSRKENDPALGIKQRFNEIYTSANILNGNEDNLQVVFSNQQGQVYPFHNSVNKAWEYPMLSATLIDRMKMQHDYRLFYYAAPAQAALDKGLSADSWEAYYGIDITRPYDKIKEDFVFKRYCALNRRYTHYITGEPYVLLGYTEQNFLLAEAALRGWIDADPATFYKEGIRSSLLAISKYTPDDPEYHYGRVLTQKVIDDFLQTPTLQLTGHFDSDLEKILDQKYIAAFMQTPYLSYYDYRRTGYPAFPINPETNMNFKEPTKIPVRWLYPSVEFSFNKENVEAALNHQYEGIDEVNKVMWLLK